MSAVCTYDNPATMMRECWQDGRLLYAYSFKILLPFARRQEIPARLFFFGANIGPWKAGQHVGDMEAIAVTDLLSAGQVEEHA